MGDGFEMAFPEAAVDVSLVLIFVLSLSVMAASGFSFFVWFVGVN